MEQQKNQADFKTKDEDSLEQPLLSIGWNRRLSYTIIADARLIWIASIALYRLAVKLATSKEALKMRQSRRPGTISTKMTWMRQSLDITSSIWRYGQMSWSRLKKWSVQNHTATFNLLCMIYFSNLQYMMDGAMIRMSLEALLSQLQIDEYITYGILVHRDAHWFVG